MYVLAKFQLRILNIFEVIALQSRSNRKIIFYCKHTENKLQALPKMIGTRILHHHVRHELRNGLLGKLFLLLSFITTHKVEIHEKTLIANDCFNVT